MLLECPHLQRIYKKKMYLLINVNIITCVINGQADTESDFFVKTS